MSWQDEFAKLAAAKGSGAGVSTKAGGVGAQRISLDNADVREVIDSHRTHRQPKRAAWILTKYRDYVARHNAGETDPKIAKNPHDACFTCACFAWREILGGLIAGDFLEPRGELYSVFTSERIPAPKEYANIICYSLKVVLAELSAYGVSNPDDPNDPGIQKYLSDRADRDFGYRHDDAMNSANIRRNGHSPNGQTANGHGSIPDFWDRLETSDEFGNRQLEDIDWLTSDAANAADANADPTDSDSGWDWSAADSDSRAGAEREKTGGATTEDRPIFKEYGPTEWAKPVEPTKFAIPGVLCQDTWGANAGPKKSLKTHENGSLALSLSSGKSLYGDDVHFPVYEPCKVLYIVGEGGEKPVIRMMHRLCRAYGIDPNDVMNDPAFPLVLEFGAAPLDSPKLRDEINEKLDRHQPGAVFMESFYNFHPAEVNAGNLYERGPVIDAYHKLVRQDSEGVISLLTDHIRSTNVGKSLDLDNIAMAGQAENVDSWIMRRPLKVNVQKGDFSLHVGFSSRQWGGTEWKIDWHLGAFDFEKGCHIGDILRDVAPASDNLSADEKDDNSKKIVYGTDDDVMAHIRREVIKNPRMTKAEHLDNVYLEILITRAKLTKLWAKAHSLGLIYPRKLERDEKDPKNPGQFKSVTRDVWLPGQGAVTAQEQRDIWGI